MQVYERDLAPREAIAGHIRESFRLIRENAAFWRLVHQVRHQPAVLQTAAGQIGEFQQHVAERLTAQFRLLGAARPELEALLLFALIDGVVTQYLLQSEQYPLEAMEHFLIHKYEHGNFLD